MEDEALQPIIEQFNLIAREYDENRRKFIPCFDAFYADTTDFLAQTLRSPRLIFDLGSGTGLLPSFWYPHVSKADYVLTDIAEDMLSVAKRRFSGTPNVSFSVQDYSRALPDTKRYGTPDLVMSALSVHHLTHTKKRELFRRISCALCADGIFVNYDQFRAESDLMNERIERWWTEHIKASGISETEYGRWLDRRKLDCECTVSEELRWLLEAGFAVADCVFCSGKFAVLVAQKGAGNPC